MIQIRSMFFETADQIAEWRRAGVTWQAIAPKIGLKATTWNHLPGAFKRWAQAHRPDLAGVVRPTRPPISPEQARWAKSQLPHKTWRQIGRELGYHYRNIQNAVARLERC